MVSGQEFGQAAAQLRASPLRLVKAHGCLGPILGSRLLQPHSQWPPATRAPARRSCPTWASSWGLAPAPRAGKPGATARRSLHRLEVPELRCYIPTAGRPRGSPSRNEKPVPRTDGRRERSKRTPVAQGIHPKTKEPGPLHPADATVLAPLVCNFGQISALSEAVAPHR